MSYGESLWFTLDDYYVTSCPFIFKYYALPFDCYGDGGINIFFEMIFKTWNINIAFYEIKL